MPRGKKAATGEERVAPNGYHYIKTKDGWRLKHHILAEEALGRPLKDSERVSFKDNDRTNFDPENLQVRKQRNRKADRAKFLRNRIHIAQEELAELEAEGY
jgi:hypothetical protein